MKRGPSVVLVVDDNPMSIAFARNALEKRGHVVNSIASPFELSAALHSCEPSLVLLDVSMPALSGDKVAEMLIRQGKHRCPVVFYSARSAEELELLVARTGADGFVEKGHDDEKFTRTVESFMNKHPPPR